VAGNAGRTSRPPKENGRDARGTGAGVHDVHRGVENVRRGRAADRSLSQMGTSVSGSAPKSAVPRIKEFVPLADLQDLVSPPGPVFPRRVHRRGESPGYWSGTSTWSRSRISSRASSRSPLRSIPVLREAAAGTNVKRGKTNASSRAAARGHPQLRKSRG